MNYAFVRGLISFGIFYHIRKIKYTYHNIFVYLYFVFGEFKFVYFKNVVNLLLIDYLELLIHNYWISLTTYADFISFICDLELEPEYRISFLKEFYKMLKQAYKWKYGSNTWRYHWNFIKTITRIFFKVIIEMAHFIFIECNIIMCKILSGLVTLMMIYEDFQVYLRKQYIMLTQDWSFAEYERFRNYTHFLLNKRLIWTKIKHSRVSNFMHPYFSILNIYNTIKSIFLPILVSLLMLFLLINFFKIEIYTNIGIWAVLGFFFLWLMSGFNFFIKRYKNGKFTSAIQRFWKRTNSYFWLVEGFLFTLFFYYYLNSSQEPLYMYDESNLNQNFLPNLTAFYFSIIILLIIIFYSYYLLLNLANFSFKQQLLHLVINSILMIYVFLIESYQFYYLINTFFEISWEYVEDLKSWMLNTENPKIRVKTQYLILALIAKYWHFIFIFFSWLFLLYKSYERGKVYYTLFGFVIQNCIILILLNLLFCVQWLKWLIRRYYDVIYYWFFTESNNWFFSDFIDSFTYLLGL